MSISGNRPSRSWPRWPSTWSKRLPNGLKRRDMMLTDLNPTKLRNEHLTRPALVYVRQSTLIQVRDNTASAARQYHLAQRAQDLGWPASLVVVIDQDQGRSGAPHAGRDGFEYLIAEVGLGRAGAVLCLEASRLARSSSDWYRLIEICALTDTLVIDEDGVYDPGQYNDRLLLGFRGTMSEAELHWLHCRLVGGTLAKAQQGTLRLRLPVGLVYKAAGQIQSALRPYRLSPLAAKSAGCLAGLFQACRPPAGSAASA